jgi:uncharacterized protein YaeQ
MALTATLHTLNIDLNDADRGIYQTLELRVARHPSESLPYMLSRILAYCLYWEADISFSRGLSTTDEPAVWVKAPDGRIMLWIDVGHPSAERLHKASKAAQRVVVCSSQDPAAFRKSVAGARIHKAEQIELVGLPVAVLEPLASQVERRMDWSVTITDNNLYLSSQGQQTLAGEIARTTLSDQSL